MGFTTQAKDAQLLDVCESILIEWAVFTKQSETSWTGGQGQTTGFEKHLALAQNIINTKAKLHAPICAILICQISPSIVLDQNNTFQYLSRASGVNVMECGVYYYNGFNQLGYQSGLTLADMLAGINRIDIN